MSWTVRSATSQPHGPHTKGAKDRAGNIAGNFGLHGGLLLRMVPQSH